MSSSAQLEADLGDPVATVKSGAKPLFRADDIAQTALVVNRLLEASGEMDAPAIAASFKQGQRIRPAVASVLLSLYRMGIIATADGGKTFTYRRAA
jgi:hypothetical protein